MPTPEQHAALNKAKHDWDAAEAAFQVAIVGISMGQPEATVILAGATTAREVARKELVRARAPFGK